MTVSERSNRGSALVVVILLLIAAGLAAAAFFALRERDSTAPPKSAPKIEAPNDKAKDKGEDGRPDFLK